jgi:hypothetical protein
MDDNALFIFTKLPDTAKELNQFLGTRLSQSRIQPNVIFDEVSSFIFFLTIDFLVELLLSSFL